MHLNMVRLSLGGAMLFYLFTWFVLHHTGLEQKFYGLENAIAVLGEVLSYCYLMFTKNEHTAARNAGM